MQIDAPEGDRVVLSACKKADERESILLRMFNPERDERRVSIHGWRPFTQAFAIDLLERRQQELPIANGRVALSLPAHRIQTIELVPAIDNFKVDA